MNIAIYYHKIEAIGGVEKAIFELSRILDENNHNVTVIFSDCNSNIEMLTKISQYADIKHIDIVKNEMFDICFYETIRPIKINALKNILIINNNWVDSMVSRKNIPTYFDEYIAVGNECKEQAEKILGQEVKVIPNIINIDEVKELSKEEVNLEKNDIIFVTVSRISKEKGFNRIPNIINELDQRKINYKFYIIGEGDNSIKREYEKYSNVIFLGKKENPYPYIKNSDYLVMLSDFESQCLVMFEALILSTPVIVTDFGTAIETIDEKMGFVLKKDLSNLDIDKIINSKLKFEYEYPNVEKQWLDLLKPIEKKDYKFTILIPNYNNAKWLDKCLNSVLNQTYKNYEIIFVDDMSEDNSLEIAKNLLKDHKVIELKSKRYNGGARNVGIVEANSDYTVSLDSDDWFANDEVLENINKHLNNEDVLFLGFQQTKDDKYYADYIPKSETKEQALKENVCAIWTKVVKTSLMKECLFSEGTLMEDKVQHFRICNKMKKFKNYPVITHYWNRGNAHSVTTDRNTKWDTSIYRFIADLTDFSYECEEEFKPFVLDLIKKMKENAEKNIYRQGK